MGQSKSTGPDAAELALEPDDEVDAAIDVAPLDDAALVGLNAVAALADEAPLPTLPEVAPERAVDVPGVDVDAPPVDDRESGVPVLADDAPTPELDAAAPHDAQALAGASHSRVPVPPPGHSQVTVVPGAHPPDPLEEEPPPGCAHAETAREKRTNGRRVICPPGRESLHKA